MRNPATLTRDQLVEIVTGMLHILCGWQDDQGNWTYTADKEWNGGDVCEAAAGLLGDFDLVPQGEGYGEGEPMDPD